MSLYGGGQAFFPSPCAPCRAQLSTDGQVPDFEPLTGFQRNKVILVSEECPNVPHGSALRCGRQLAETRLLRFWYFGGVWGAGKGEGGRNSPSMFLESFLVCGTFP